MSRTFTLNYKDGGLWVSLNAVFPFVTGDLLDERLDEATVTFYSTTKSFKPLTEFKVEFFKDGVADSSSNKEYFILANDNSAEVPSGSGYYRHEVYLIERTKLLEGVLCPSVTFTNSLGNEYSKIRNRVYAILDGSRLKYTSLSDLGLYSPISSTQDTVIPKPQYIGNALVKSYNDTHTLPASETDEEFVNASLDIIGENGNAIISNAITEITLTPNLIENNTYIYIVYTVNSRYYIIPSEGLPRPVNNTTTITYQIYIAKDNSPLKPYTITDCVVRVLELAEPLIAGERPRFTFEGCILDGNRSVSGYEAGSQAERYSKINAPEFSMTQATLWEQLKVIGSYIHAEPYLDENNIIHFLDLGVQEPNTTLANKPYISNTLKTDINGYCTDIRSNVQNLVNSLGYAKGAVIDPGNGLYRSLRCETMYVRISAENGIAETDYPVYSIDKVMCGIMGESSPWRYEPKEITPYVFEATEYGANLSNFGGGYPYSKSWAIYYTQGEKGLHGLFFQDPNAVSQAKYSPFAIANILASVNGVSPKEIYDYLIGELTDIFSPESKVPNIVFQITYKPIAPGFVSHGKQYFISGDTLYTQIYNQGENAVETQYFGESMKGVAARLGNIEQTRTYILDSRDEIPNAGQLLGEYAISVVNTEYLPEFIKCTVGLSKDYNRISEYVGVNSVKRMYEISERQAVERDILIKEDIVITRNSSMTDDAGVFFLRKEAILGAFTQSGYNDSVVKFALFYGYKKNQEYLNKPVLLPVLGRAFGNTIHFALKFKDNYSAGNRVDYNTNNGISGYWQNDVPYTDYYGRVYWGKLIFTTIFPDVINNPTLYAEQLPSGKLPDSVLASAVMWATHTYAVDVANVALSAPYHRVRKDNREILGFNVEAEFKTTEEDIIIGSELAARCKYLGSTDAVPRLYVSKKPLNKLSKYEPECVAISDIGGQLYGLFNITLSGIGTGTDNYLTVSLDYRWLYDQGYRSWFIATETTASTEVYVDEDGNTVTGDVYTGGEILIGGTLEKYRTSNGEWISPSEMSYGKAPINLYFRTKRPERR